LSHQVGEFVGVVALLVAAEEVLSGHPQTCNQDRKAVGVGLESIAQA
jgi:hypothetical protein